MEGGGERGKEGGKEGGREGGRGGRKRELHILRREKTGGGEYR